jgi:two-component system KDP operon response regulator KdpE
LLARVRAALRRATVAGRDAPEPLLRIGTLELDLPRRIARVEGGEPLRLTPREWDLLAALAHAGPGRVLTQRQLLTAVWGPAHAEDAQYLRIYIGHLRQKLGEAGRLIRTEPGIGYRFGDAECCTDRSAFRAAATRWATLEVDQRAPSRVSILLRSAVFP